jgi:uncharacterized protein YjbI with pentapeptide repeats
LENANLEGANLTNANLRYADLSNANLTGAILDGADVRGVTGIVMPTDDLRNTSYLEFLESPQFFVFPEELTD